MTAPLDPAILRDCYRDARVAWGLSRSRTVAQADAWCGMIRALLALPEEDYADL